MPPAIAVDDLHKRYGSLHALKGVSVTVEQGAFFGLLGPNGAGKSTLINILAGLVRPTSGTALLNGHNVISDYIRARRQIGVVPQELVFDPFFTVREVLRLQAGYYGLGRAAHGWIDHLVDALNLADKADTNMRALSGGMKRRVLVAQALVHKPAIVVLDEPTAGVDVELRKVLWSFVRQLHGEGHTIVLTTHYLEEAQALCERIAILNRGKIIALDSTAALLARGSGSQRRLRVTLAAPCPALPPALAAMLRRQDSLALLLDLPSGCVVLDVLDALRSSGAIIQDVHSEQQDLEDIFLTLTTQAESS